MKILMKTISPEERLKHDLELLRGEPIIQMTSSGEVASFEVSDPEELCKAPLVSVRMITFNHEKYIADAIEGVVNQKCNFEYELIIGEDRSTDNTRDVCLAFQKRYPNIIRVLYSEKNVGGWANSCRTRMACRGEYMALCEGDDYWCDPLKLQKQVDVFKALPSISLVFSEKFNRKDTCPELIPTSLKKAMGMPDGLIGSAAFYDYLSNMGVIPTASAMYRTSDDLAMRVQYSIFSWKLALGDITLWYGLAMRGDVFHFPEPMIVYRIHDGGVSHNKASVKQVFVDGTIPRMYFDVVGRGRRLWLSQDIVFTLVGRMRQASGQGFKHRFKRFCETCNVGFRFLWFYHPVCIACLLAILFALPGVVPNSLMKLLKLRWRVLKRLAPGVLWSYNTSSKIP